MLHLKLSKFVWIASVITFVGWPALAQEAPHYYTGQWPNAHGDYPLRRQYQGAWRVVDPDPNGLNCRGNMPPGGGSQTIVTRFFQGTRITVVKRERGILEIAEDVAGNPWLRVQVGQDQECWLRANQRYVVPMAE